MTNKRDIYSECSGGKRRTNTIRKILVSNADEKYFITDDSKKMGFI